MSSRTDSKALKTRLVETFSAPLCLCGEEHMNFDLTEEQQMLKDSVQRFLEKNCSFEQRRKMLAERMPMNAQLWEGLASLGVLGVPFSPDYGGFGGGGSRPCWYGCAGPASFARALSRHRGARGRLRRSRRRRLAEKDPDPEDHRRLDAAGVCACRTERPLRTRHVEARAVRDGSNFVLEGEKTLVLHGP